MPSDEFVEVSRPVFILIVNYYLSQSSLDYYKDWITFFTPALRTYHDRTTVFGTDKDAYMSKNIFAYHTEAYFDSSALYYIRSSLLDKDIGVDVGENGIIIKDIPEMRILEIKKYKDVNLICETSGQ